MELPHQFFPWLKQLAVIITDPCDAVFLVLGPVYPVHAVRESELCYPVVMVLLSLGCNFSHFHQLYKVNLQPLFAVVSFCTPGSISFTISV